MKKLLQLTGISVVAIMTANVANAAGYTCEELIEYTSCNPGYALSMGDYICPDGYVYKTGICNDQESYYYGVSSLETCEPYLGWDSGQESEWWAGACIKEDALQEGSNRVDQMGENIIFIDGYTPGSCNECLAGYYCAGGTDAMTPCAAGTYQPNTKQTSCITTPQGNYSAAGATAYTACPTSDLTDASGNVVSVTTASDGATSSAECFVAKGTLFKDAKGIYKYTDNCIHGNFGSYYVMDEDGAPNECVDGYEEGYDPGYCYRVPTTEETCLVATSEGSVAATWDGEKCHCDTTPMWDIRWDLPGKPVYCLD